MAEEQAGGIYEHVIEQFMGTNTVVDMGALPLAKSPAALNGWSDRFGKKFKKRPGLTKITTNAVAGSIYEAGHFSLPSAVDTFQIDADSLLVIYKLTADNIDYAGQINLYAPGDVVPIAGGLGVANTNYDRRLVCCGSDRVLATSQRVSGNPCWLIANLSTPFWQRDVTSLPPTGYIEAALHRESVVCGVNLDNSLLHTIRWSAYGAPTSYPAANNNKWHPTGAYDILHGIRNTGDLTYMFRGRSVWAMSGAVAEYFRLEGIKQGTGGGQGAAYADIGDGALVGWAMRPRAIQKLQYVHETMVPDGIMMIQGFQAKRVDGEILNEFALSMDNKFSERTRACYWPGKHVVICSKRVALIAGESGSDHYVMHLGGGDTPPWFWKWTFHSSIGESAMVAVPPKAPVEATPVYKEDRVYVTCVDGHVRFLDETNAQDDGNDFVCRYTSGGLRHPGNVLSHVVHVKVEVGITSGADVWTVEVSQDGKAFTTIGTFLPVDGHTQLVTCPGRVGSGYIAQTRVTVGADNVGAEMRRLSVGQEPVSKVRATPTS
jgi:hypothetical protein